jgi:glutathione synthase/RimK-type ligase-like ATP-grasp enzyme
MARLGLSFGALDFVLTPDGRFVFLEINPNGQWMWLDDKLGFGITDAVVDWLCAHTDP